MDDPDIKAAASSALLTISALESAHKETEMQKKRRHRPAPRLE